MTEDFPKFIETPFGNKNPLPNQVSKEDKKYNTIYNNDFKSYMDLKYGTNKNNNNEFNNNYNNNCYNYNNNENSDKFNNQINDNNQNQINNDINEPNNATHLFKH